MANEGTKKLAIYASPECCRGSNLNLYKGYYNVAWFVRAYSELLKGYEVFTTDETMKAVKEAVGLDKELDEIWDLTAARFEDEWRVPSALDTGFTWSSLGAGFDAQVELAAMVAKRKVDRLLMFQDPDDVQTHLPEAYALIRNCTLANVALNINAGATFWAETQWQKKKKKEKEGEFGPWRTNPGGKKSFHALLNPSKQKNRVHFPRQ